MRAGGGGDNGSAAAHAAAALLRPGGWMDDGGGRGWSGVCGAIYDRGRGWRRGRWMVVVVMGGRMEGRGVRDERRQDEEVHYGSPDI